MGFTLIAAAVALQRPPEADPDGAASMFVAFLLLTSVAMWAIDRFGGPIHGTARRYGVRIGVVALLVMSGTKMINLEPASRSAATHVATGGAYPTGPVVVDDHINWVPFDSSLVASMRAANRPVFIDYTADWCANCKTNERLFIEVPRIREVLTETGSADGGGPDRRQRRDQRLARALPLRGHPVYAIYLRTGRPTSCRKRSRPSFWPSVCWPRRRNTLRRRSTSPTSRPPRRLATKKRS